MGKIIIESSNPGDSAVEIEEKLEKAVDSIKLQRERRELKDTFLRDEKEKADKAVKAIFDNMVDEIAKVLGQY